MFYIIGCILSAFFGFALASILSVASDERHEASKKPDATDTMDEKRTD